MFKRNLCMLLSMILAFCSCLALVPADVQAKNNQDVEAAQTEGFALDERETKTGKLKLTAADDEIDNGEAESYLASEYVYADYKYVDEMDKDSCYYYSHMSEKQQGIYAAFLNAAQDGTDVTVYHFADKDGDGYTMTSEEVTDTYQGFLFDHPECWWMGLRYLFSRTKNADGEYDNDFVTGVRLYQAYESQDEWKTDMNQVEEAAKAYLEAVDSDAPEAVIALELHDRLLDQVSYDNTADKYSNSHNAFGALVSGSAVCDGYALGLKYVLRKAGINSTIIPGTVKTGKHAWIVVRLGGSWYECDPTWNDQNDYDEQHLYYNLTTDELTTSAKASVKHTREFEGFTSELPVAEGTHFTYAYMCEGLSLAEKPSDYKYMKNTNLSSSCELACYGEETDDQWVFKPVDLEEKALSNVWRVKGIVPDGLKLHRDWNAEKGNFVVERKEGSSGTYEIGAVIIFDNGLTSEPTYELTVKTAGSGSEEGGGEGGGEEGGEEGGSTQDPDDGKETEAKKGSLVKKKGDTYCRTEDGEYLTGFQEVDGNLYYFDPDTKKMVVGWNTIDNEKYYMGKSNGVVRRGMKKIDEKFYYFHPETGVMQKGYQKINGYTYYFSKKTGIRATKWQTIGDGKAYFGSIGRMWTGFKNIGNYRYYLDPETGLRHVGFTEVDGNTYYMNKYGRIQTGLQTIDGSRYYFSSSGKMQTGWKTINGKKYYFYKKGARKGKAATGTAKIGDTWYTFSSKGVYRKKGK